jgi:8-oxo-dGTP diphosphatase
VSDRNRIRVVSAAITNREGKYLITQRLPTATLPLLWEFPGGRVEAGESDGDALRRELKYRIGVEVEVAEHLSQTSCDYERYTVELHLYSCRIVDGEAAPANVKDLRWVSAANFDDYEFTPADEDSMNALLGL